ncbi:hypothetical protein DFQ26_007334 [Actinomortierella ambigua]|nr:hypothetical protein DFQ26_007334 [Actinomortierella ambigua]
MKFTSIAVAAAAFVATTVSAAQPFSWGCSSPVRYYGAKDLNADIMQARTNWNNDRTLFNGRSISFNARYLQLSCTANSDNASSVLQSDCWGAMSWLWNTVRADVMDAKGFVPRSCWVQNGSLYTKWDSK